MESLELMPGLRIHSRRFLTVGSTIVIADLHLGYESALANDGMMVPRIQTKQMIESLTGILDDLEPDRVVVLGDLKHEFSRNLDQEWREVRSVLSLLSDSSDVVVVRGNHDNYLATITSGMDIPLVDSLDVDGITLVHGHVECGSRPIILGHEHPSVRLMDTVGAYVKLPCFIHDPELDIIVVPAFSPLALGTDLASVEEGDFFSPILRDNEMGRSMVTACSDIGLMQLGTLSGLSGLRV
jgi:hypothetical protein